MKDDDVARIIIKYAGGGENISKAVHCITRLRLYINDESKFNKDKINEELGLQVVVAGGQHQVVIGPGKVDRVYDEVIKQTNLVSFDTVDADEDEEEKNIAEKGKDFKKKENLFNRLLAIISSIFAPMLGILAATGMIKGVTACLTAAGLIAVDGHSYAILNAIGDTFFAMLPIFVGFYAMKTFKGTPMVGAVIGAILVNPTITAIAPLQDGSNVIYTLFQGTAFQTPVTSEVFGIPVLSVGALGYQYSVIPIIFITYFAAKLERWCKSWAPDAVGLFLIPFITIFVSAFLGLIIFGPIFSLLTVILSNFFLWLSTISPLVYGFVLAGSWKILVLFGLHWALIPISFLQFAQLQAGSIDKMTFLSSTFVASFATIGAVLGIMMIDKSQKTNAIAVPAFITGIFGITEPCLYGVLLPRRITFWIACFASAIGGSYMSVTNSGTYTTGGTGVFGFPTYIDPNITGFIQQADFFNAIIGCLIAFVLAWILVLVMYGRQVRKARQNMNSSLLKK